jgi:hypothetical protein
MVLLEGTRADPHEIVFLALVELVVRGGARIVQVPGGEVGECALAPADPNRTYPRPLAALAGLIVAASWRAAGRSEFAPSDLMREMFARHWPTTVDYVRGEVWPSLAERGLASTERELIDAPFVLHPWHLSAEGERERSELQEALGNDGSWRRTPASSLLTARGLAVPGDATFDAIDELEDLITPQ